MDKRFVVRPVRQRDLDRILEIEAASFGADAYDRNLFAEYTHKCGGLFLVAELGTKYTVPQVRSRIPRKPLADARGSDRSRDREGAVSRYVSELMKRNTKVCAYSITAISPGRLGNRAELVSMAVAPAFRRKGAASALMDSTLRRLRRRGIARLALMVKVTNKRAREFYAGYGFRKLRRVPGYYEDGADGLSLAKDL